MANNYNDLYNQLNNYMGAAPDPWERQMVKDKMAQLQQAMGQANSPAVVAPPKPKPVTHLNKKLLLTQG